MASDENDQHRVDIGETEARGARSVGFVWILVVSLAVAVVVLAIVTAWFAGSLNEANRRAGVPKAAAAQFHTPAAAPSNAY
ncbi:MAG: hypothetical protein ACREEB_05165 [Caulobacteraceae bacterium]